MDKIYRIFVRKFILKSCICSAKYLPHTTLEDTNTLTPLLKLRQIWPFDHQKTPKIIKLVNRIHTIDNSHSISAKHLLIELLKTSGFSRPTCETIVSRFVGVTTDIPWAFEFGTFWKHLVLKRHNSPTWIVSDIPCLISYKMLQVSFPFWGYIGSQVLIIGFILMGNASSLSCSCLRQTDL